MTITAKASIPLKGNRWLAWSLVVGLADVDSMVVPGVPVGVVGFGGAVRVWLLQLVILQQLNAKLSVKVQPVLF